METRDCHHLADLELQDGESPGRSYLMEMLSMPWEFSGSAWNWYSLNN